MTLTAEQSTQHRRNKAHSTARSGVHSTAQDATSGTDSTPDACVTCRLSWVAPPHACTAWKPLRPCDAEGWPAVFSCSLSAIWSVKRVSGGSASQSRSNEPACISIEKQGFTPNLKPVFYLLEPVLNYQ